MSGIRAKTVVVPVGFSDESFAALDVTMDITRSPTGVHVFHVLPELNLAEAGVICQKSTMIAAADTLRKRCANAYRM